MPYTVWAQPSIWWFELNVQMVYLSYLSNGTYVSFIADYIFLKKKRIVFTIGASTLSLICFLYNNTFVLKIVCVDFSIRVFRKRLKCYASRKSCINKMFLSPKRLILFKKRHDLSTVDTKWIYCTTFLWIIILMASTAVCSGVSSPGGALFIDGPTSRTIAMASCKPNQYQLYLFALPHAHFNMLKIAINLCREGYE